MDELSVIGTVTEVVKASRSLYSEFSNNHIISVYKKQDLKDALQAYTKIRKSQREAQIYDNNMQILERAFMTIEKYPPNTPLYNRAMRQFNILADDLENLLREY